MHFSYIKIEKVTLVRLTDTQTTPRIAEEIVEEFKIVNGETHYHKKNKRAMKPRKTTLGYYLYVGDYKRWYIKDRLLIEVEELESCLDQK